VIETSSLSIAEIKEGDKFGLLTVVGLRTKGVWDCRCVCTRTRLVPGTKLQIGAVDRCASCHDYHTRVTEVMAHRSGYTPEQWAALETAWLQHVRACINHQQQPMTFMVFETQYNEVLSFPVDEVAAGVAPYEARDYSTHYDRAFEKEAVEDENAPADDDDDTAVYELRRRTRNDYA